MTPNMFFIIGAQRCGTTYLYNLLDQHPDIQMAKPIRPEPKYFLQEENNINVNHYLHSYFPNSTGKKALIEKSTTYIESINAGKRINRFFPSSKIVIILRNPIDRAISNYYFTKNSGFETRKIEDVFINRISSPHTPKGISTNPFLYIERSKYTNYLVPYLNEFGSTRIHVLILEELLIHESKTNELYNFLGVSNQSIISKKKINSSSPVNIPIEIKKTLEGELEESILELENHLNRNLDIWRTNDSL